MNVCERCKGDMTRKALADTLRKELDKLEHTRKNINNMINEAICRVHRVEQNLLQGFDACVEEEVALKRINDSMSIIKRLSGELINALELDKIKDLV